MEEIETKVDNTSTLPASQFNNNVRNELQNAVTTSGQTLSAANLNQLGEAMGRYGGGGGDFYTESGVANAYVLTPISPFITSKVYFNGMKIIFVAGNSSTAASTVNVNTIGVKNLRDAKGLAIGKDVITSGDTFTAIFNSVADHFRIISSSRVLPFGLISLFVGAITDIPVGWQICDGTNGTPDLRNNFLRGAGSTFAVNDTGGSETTGGHSLTIAELAAHSHGYNLFNATQGTGDDNGPLTMRNTTSVNQTVSTGSGTAHTHPSTVPPFYALAFIMKL